MKKSLGKILLIMTVVVTAVLFLAFSASALNAEGQCGENVYWDYNSTTGHLVISGKGPMYEYKRSETPFATSGIKSVSINSGVTTVGRFAFTSCADLLSVTIGDDVTSIGYGAFYNSTKLANVKLGADLADIADFAFNDCYALTEVTFPDSMKSIGYAAFKECSGLKSVTMGKSLKSIGDYAFQQCLCLTGITIPDSVVSIGDGAFYRCEDLKNVIIGKGLSDMGDFAFFYAEALEGITVDKNNLYYTSDECGVLFDKNKTTLIKFPPKNGVISYAIPNTVKKIADYAIQDCRSLRSVTIPTGVKTIGSGNFNVCNGLMNITIPASVTSIGSGVFVSCHDLVRITVDKNNQYYTSDDCGVLFNKNKTMLIRFPEASAVNVYSVPDGVATIGEFAFNNCKLKRISIPKSIINIREYAFNWCEELKEVVYTGTQEQWKNITIESNNEYLTTATFYYENQYPVCTLPAPDDIKATQTVAIVRLSWSNVSGADLYRIYQITDGEWKSVAVVTETSYLVTGLTSGTKYTFAVKAGETEGNSTIWSDSYTTISTATKPTPPTAITATQTTSSITLNWSKSEGATGYRVYQYSPSKGTYVMIASLKGKTTYTKSKNLKAGSQYKFKIKPYIKLTDGTVIWGSDSDVFTTATKPIAPTKVTATTTKSTITLNWSKSAGATGYRVYQYSPSKGKYVMIESLKGKTSYKKSKNLKANTTYKFKIKPYVKLSDGTVIWGSASSAFAFKTKTK